MTNNQDVEIITTKFDVVVIFVAVLCVIAGVVGFALLTDQSMTIRLGTLVGGFAVGFLVAYISPAGKRLTQYLRRSYEELRRVVWPTKKETLNTTGMVFAFVLIMAIFLAIVDKLIEFGLYDVLLKFTI